MTRNLLKVTNYKNKARRKDTVPGVTVTVAAENGMEEYLGRRAAEIGTGIFEIMNF